MLLFFFGNFKEFNIRILELCEIKVIGKVIVDCVSYKLGIFCV